MATDPAMAYLRTAVRLAGVHRFYTRRVLQTYGIYSWLDTGKLPDLPRTPPPAPPR